MLEVITAKLRPLFVSKYRSALKGAKNAALKAGMSEKERGLYLSGFEHGWLRGATDAVSVKAGDLRSSLEEADPDPVH